MSSQNGVLNKRQRGLVGKGKVLIDADLARSITTMFQELPKKTFPASAERVAQIVQEQLCDWCDGMGWQICNMGEDVAGCSNCGGSGIQPIQKRKKITTEPLPKKKWDESLKGCHSVHPLSDEICQRKNGNHKIHKRLHHNKQELETWT